MISKRLTREDLRIRPQKLDNEMCTNVTLSHFHSFFALEDSYFFSTFTLTCNGFIILNQLISLKCLGYLSYDKH